MKNIFALLLLVPLNVSASFTYPGCPSPGTQTRTIIIDGNKGETLQGFFTAKKILPGDRVIVRGPQGSVLVTKERQPAFTDPAHWTKIEGEGAVFESIDFRGVSKFHFSKIKINRNTRGNSFALAATKNIILSDSEIYGAQDSSDWEVQDWLEAPNGVHSDNATCVSIVRNKLKNLRFGITLSTRAQVSSASSVKGLVQDNELRNLSGDFLRPNGSDITLLRNRGYDGYLSAEDGDANHDDFIQGFAYPLGIEYSNVQMIDNYFLESTNPSRRFNSDYQGIGIFDGLFVNYRIKGNIILAGAYHGISIYGGKSGIIENNTVLSNDGTRKFRIFVPASKKAFNSAPSQNIIVRNNIANMVLKDPANTGVSFANNYDVNPQDMALHFQLFDIQRALFNLALKSSSPLFGKGAGALDNSPAPTAPEPSAPALTYAVFNGCEVPASSFSRKVILDGAKGETLQKYFDSKLARAGDHIVVKGNQGSFITSKYHRSDLVDSMKWIRIEGQGAIFKSIDIRDVRKFLITGVRVQRKYENGYGSLINLANAQHVVVADSVVSSDGGVKFTGLRSDNSTCVSSLRNQFSGMGFGIQVYSRSATPATHSLKVLLRQNKFSAISRDDVVRSGKDIRED